MGLFGDIVRIPDFWQSEAVGHLAAGRDVVIDAPTGAGKTYVFELFVEKHFSGRAVYTVPTRALANDKYSEWKARGWRVGISTGDYNVDTDAPIVVATLETQKNNFFSGKCPDLLVIDEYQLISDPIRGFNYELAVALAPKNTRLLLMSGSVANAERVRGWIAGLGRDCRLVSHAERPVPLEEIAAAALGGDASGVSGMWPKFVKKIIDADFAPVLIFAPHRAEAESIARKLAAGLPCPDFLNLPRSDASAAGRELGNMLRRRVAFHHSGLSAFQRSAIVEKYAREGALKAVVATTGLGAGVNFSMRSVVVVSREYETAAGTKILRPDELLQMYGRAGRRGKDKLGFAITLPAKPRLSDARQAQLARVDAVDSAASIRVMARAVDNGEDHIAALEKFYKSLFVEEPVDVGLNAAVAAARRRAGHGKSASRNSGAKGADERKVEILNSRNVWERRRFSAPARLDSVLFFDGAGWTGFLKCRRAVESLKVGRVCALENGTFGLLLEIAVARDGGFMLTKTARRFSAEARSGGLGFAKCFDAKILGVKNIKRNFGKFLGASLAGAEVRSFELVGDVLRARVDLAGAKVRAVSDGFGANLYKPPEREVDVSGEYDFEKLSGLGDVSDVSKVGEASRWVRFGFVDADFKPTTRGRIFSFFNGGEGYAVAAALEDESYALEDLVFDLANLRAGGRFHLSATNASVSSRLADVCRTAFFAANVRGALKAGVPLTYGEGASEIVRDVFGGAAFSKFESDLILRGDVERAYLEWRSMLRHIAFLPDVENPRFRDLKALCAKMC